MSKNFLRVNCTSFPPSLAGNDRKRQQVVERIEGHSECHMDSSHKTATFKSKIMAIYFGFPFSA